MTNEQVPNGRKGLRFRCLCALGVFCGSILTACVSESVPSPTLPPIPTSTPHPTPTPTPLPPVPLTIYWPATASALEEVTLQVDLPGLAERDPAARVRARVTDPRHQVWWESDMDPAGERTYTAPIPLHLPLEPPEGEWRLTVFIYTAVAVNGGRTIVFRPAPVPRRDLSGQVREGITLHVPQPFAAVKAEGDEIAGGRAWIGSGGEVGLWWTPGPAEPLVQDTAQVLVEATHPTSGPAEVVEIEPVEWNGLPAFRFSERWPEGPAEALVVQGPDRWLYLLRVRALDGEVIPPLLMDILATLRLEE